MMRVARREVSGTPGTVCWRFSEVPGKDNHRANEGRVEGEGDHAAFREIKTRAGKECEIVGWTGEAWPGFIKGSS